MLPITVRAGPRNNPHTRSALLRGRGRMTEPSAPHAIPVDLCATASCSAAARNCLTAKASALPRAAILLSAAVTGHAAESGITQSLTQYDRLVPQCLLIAPSYADLSVLRTVLAELGFTAMTTMQLLVGAQLATVPLDEFAFAVAVLPPSRSDGAPAAASATIFLEAGIALGRGLPLIVLAEDPDEDLPVFGGLASNVWTVVNAKDAASIRLHLTLFTKVLETHGPPGDSEPLLPASAATVKPSTKRSAGAPGIWRKR
jgi:hypothetical protein